MKQYKITFKSSEDIFSENIVKAESAEQAAAYYSEDGYTVIGCDEFSGTVKPGQPVIEIPQGWKSWKERAAEVAAIVSAAKPENKVYLSYITEVRQCNDGRRRLYSIGRNFTIEASRCEHDLKDPHDLMNIWKKAGYISRVLPSHVVINTYYTDAEGCRGRYNITEKNSEDGKRRVIDFNYLREATLENELDLIAGCICEALEDGAIKTEEAEKVKIYQLVNAQYSDGREVKQRPLEWVLKNQNGARVTVSPCLFVKAASDCFAVCFYGRNGCFTLEAFQNLKEAQNCAGALGEMTCEKFVDYLRSNGEGHRMNAADFLFGDYLNRKDDMKK